MTTQDVVHAFIAAVEARDMDAIMATFAEDAVYQNVGEPEVVGAEAIRALFARVIERSDRIVWDVYRETYDGDTGWLERNDRFWISGTEFGVRCNGIFVVDAARGVITDVRDYLDITGWRRRIAGRDEVTGCA